MQVFLIDETNSEDKEFWQSVNPAALAMSRKSPDGKALAYVCQNFTCQAPTTDPAALEQLLRQTYSGPKISSFKLGSVSKWSDDETKLCLIKLYLFYCTEPCAKDILKLWNTLLTFFPEYLRMTVWASLYITLIFHQRSRLCLSWVWKREYLIIVTSQHLFQLLIIMDT